MARQNTESGGKGAAGAVTSERPIDRFKSLARKLVKVPREEFEEERRKERRPIPASRHDDDAPT